MSGTSNVINTTTQTTFKFVGQFRDVNIIQVFKIDYVTSSNPSATYLATFKKIKSLFYSDRSLAFPPCNVIRPNQTQPIVFPRCQTASTTISFPNISWFTNFENPELCFGAVTDYEYQLPANWSIAGNANPSNGSNWLAGGNNVVVTSDLSTGDGADIKMRASNKSCGTGLASNGSISTVRISRPAPTSITGGTSLLCSGSSSYTLNIIPPGASISWTLSNTSVAGIPIPSNGNSVTVTRVGSGNANTILTANVSDCSGTYPPINFTIAVGTPGNVSLQVNNAAFDFCSTGLMQFDAALENPSPTTQLNWSVVGRGARIKFGAGGYTPVLTINQVGTFEIVGTITNLCGSSTFSSGEFNSADFWSNYCGIYRFSVSPNPVKGNMNIVFNKPIKENENVNMRLYTLNSSLSAKQWLLKGGQKQFSLNISELKTGHYVLEVAIGNSKQSKQIIIE